MIAASDLRKGMTFSYEGEIWVCLDFQHNKTGRGGAVERIKMKNIITGNVRETTFLPTEKVPKAHIEKKDMQYIYNDDDLYYFMDTETYEQIPLNKSNVEDAIPYLIDGTVCTIHFYQGNAFRVEPPIFVNMKITFCEPAVAGDTARSALKPATLETGLVVQVPLFVNEGETIKVDTRTGQYAERV